MAGPAAQRAWARGLRYAYDARLSTAVAFAAAENSFDFDVLGRLELEATKLDGDAVTLQASFADAKVVSRIPSAQPELDRLGAELRNSGVFFTLKGGRLAELFVAPEMSTMAASTYRALASALQFAEHAGAPGPYTAEEYDTTGQYVAEYTPAPVGVWHKRKLRYLGLLGASAMPKTESEKLVPEVVDSSGEVKVTGDGRPLSVKLAERLSLTGAQVPVRSSASLELTSGGEPRVSPGTPGREALLGKMKRVAASAPLPQTAAKEDVLDDAKVGGLDFKTILTRYGALAARIQARASQSTATPEPTPTPERQAERESDLREEARLFQALAASFRREPARTLDAVARVRSGSPLANRLVDALGSAGTAEAHRALGKVVEATNLDAEVRDRALFALARTRRPTDDAIFVLKRVLARAPHESGALYGLGTYSRWFRDQGDLARATALGDFLTAQLPLARGPLSLADVLRAVANSGYVGALPRVLPYLEDRREEVRAAAVRALQSMQTPSIDGLIAARLRSDPSADVRLAAIESAKLREANDVVAAALIEQSTHGDDRHVRFRAVELMSEWLAARPALRATLEQIAKNDAEPKIRERAQAAL